jgi:putative membrane protein
MMGGLGTLLTLLLLIGIGVLVVWVLKDRGVLDRAKQGEGESLVPKKQEESPEEILKERFARGEISVEEYEERRHILREEEAPAARR